MRLKRSGKNVKNCFDIYNYTKNKITQHDRRVDEVEEIKKENVKNPFCVYNYVNNNKQDRLVEEIGKEMLKNCFDVCNYTNNTRQHKKTDWLMRLKRSEMYFRIYFNVGFVKIHYHKKHERTVDKI